MPVMDVTLRKTQVTPKRTRAETAAGDGRTYGRDRRRRTVRVSDPPPSLVVLGFPRSVGATRLVSGPRYRGEPFVLGASSGNEKRLPKTVPVLRRLAI